MAGNDEGCAATRSLAMLGQDDLARRAGEASRLVPSEVDPELVRLLDEVVASRTGPGSR